MLIDADGILYRGVSLTTPDEVWDYPRKRWVPYHGGALAEAREIDPDRAEALKSNNSAAEYFAYYDTPPWAQPYRPALELPDYILERQAEYAAELAARKKT